MLFGLLILIVGVFFRLCYQEVRPWLYPLRTPAQPLPEDSPFTEVILKTEDDLTIYGWYAPSETGQVILMLHGLSSNRDHFMAHTDYLFDAGYGILSIDFRNHGDSDGDITSMGVYEIRDARAAYEFLQEQNDIQQIVIMGHSLGGAVASQLMQEVDADGLIIDATFTDFASIVRAGAIARGFRPTPIAEILVKIAGLLSQADWTSVRPIDFLGSIDKPILLLHGSHDLTIPIENAYRLVDANSQIKLVEFENGAHSNLYEVDPDLYKTEVLAYLDSMFD